MVPCPQRRQADRRAPPNRLAPLVRVAAGAAQRRMPDPRMSRSVNVPSGLAPEIPSQCLPGASRGPWRAPAPLAGPAWGVEDAGARPARLSRPLEALRSTPSAAALPFETIAECQVQTHFTRREWHSAPVPVRPLFIGHDWLRFRHLHCRESSRSFCQGSLWRPWRPGARSG